MATQYGVTPYGFRRKDLGTIKSELQQTFQSIWGSDFNVADNSDAGYLINILAERENELWAVSQASHYARTLQGSEGIYVDDFLTRKGSARLLETPAGGFQDVVVSKDTPYGFLLEANKYSFGDFKPTRDTKLKLNLSSWVIKQSELTVGTYVFTIYNQQTAAFVGKTLNLSDKTIGSASLNTFFNDLKSFVVSNTEPNFSNSIFINTAQGVIYLGFAADTTKTGLPYYIDLTVDKLVGERTYKVELIKKDVGYFEVVKDTLKAINPTFIGFVSTSNQDDFFFGRSIETDTEAKARYPEIEAEGKATSSAIKNALLDGNIGVRSVEILRNKSFTIDVDEVAAQSLMCIVEGGSVIDIANKIYNTKSATTDTSGSISVSVPNPDKSPPELIRFSRPSYKNFVFKFSYKKRDGTQMLQQDQLRLESNLISAVDDIRIGGELNNFDLQFNALSGVDTSQFSRFGITFAVKGTQQYLDTYQLSKKEKVSNVGNSFLYEVIP